MNYTVERRDKIVIFTLKHQKLNTEVSAKFKAELLIICQQDIDALVLDLSMVEMVDSSGLGCLLLAHRQLKEHAIPFALIGLQPMVKSLISISQIEHLFLYYDTADKAVEELEKDANFN